LHQGAPAVCHGHIQNNGEIAPESEGVKLQKEVKTWAGNMIDIHPSYRERGRKGFVLLKRRWFPHYERYQRMGESPPLRAEKSR
jgi:hypothetical protein